MTNLISECLKVINESEQGQLHFHSNSIKIKTGNEFVDLINQKGQKVSARQVIGELLEEEEKKKLFQDMKIAGTKKLDGLEFSFDFQIDFAGVAGSMALKGETKAMWTFPAVALEQLQKKHGLSLLFGARMSGKTSAIASLLRQFENRQKIIAVYSDKAGTKLTSEGNVLFNFPVTQLTVNGHQENADIIVIDSIDKQNCEKALNLAEMGYQVLLALPFWSLQMGIERFVDIVGSQSSSSRAAQRLASVLQFAFGLKLVGSDAEAKTGVYELLINDKNSQVILSEGRFSEITKIMKEGSERSGMKTLNQSLFQLMLKRKIDFRNAFEASNDPEELDGLLKKVGI